MTGEPRSAPAQIRPALPVVLSGLCITQITSWGVLFYAFTVLQGPIVAETGWAASAVTAAFSAALVISGLLGIPLGRVLDARGPRMIMTVGSVVGTLALLLIAWSPNFWVFLCGWLAAGTAMSATLYPPAFAAVTRWYGPRRVFALTVITLVGGLASTVFAPLTELLAGQLSWQQTYAVLALLLAILTIPLHAVVLRRPWPRSAEAHLSQEEASEPDRATASGVAASSAATASSGRETGPDRGITSGAKGRTEQGTGEDTEQGTGEDDATYARRILASRNYILMVTGMALGGVAMFAAMVNMVPMLVERGTSPMLAAWVLGLGGVGQVLGRLVYAPLAQRLGVRSRSVLVYGLLAATTAALTLDVTAAALLILISMLAGTARGIATLLQATAVTDRWGTRCYGWLSGVLSAPIMLSLAVAPALGAILAELLGGYEAMFAALAGVAAVACVCIAFSVPAGAQLKPVSRA